MMQKPPPKQKPVGHFAAAPPAGNSREGRLWTLVRLLSQMPESENLSDSAAAVLSFKSEKRAPSDLRVLPTCSR